MADKKVTQLTSLSTPASEDLLLIIDDPSGTPVSKQISVKNLAGGLPNTAISGSFIVSNNSIRITTPKTPASASATGTTGDIAWDTSFIYVCVATNTWKRVAISTF